MNAFRDAQRVEQIGKIDAMKMMSFFASSKNADVLDLTACHGRFVKELQERGADFLLRWPGGRLVTVDLKSEADDRFGNFFLESYSNGSRRKPGWMRNTELEVVLYQFQAQRVFYWLNMSRLRKWAFNPGGRDNVSRFPERKQAKRDQRNDTWGWCVPIQVIEDEVGFEKFAWEHGGYFLVRKGAQKVGPLWN